MIRRMIGYVLLIVSLSLLVWDGFDWIRTGDAGFRSLGSLWYMINVGSLNLAQAVIQRYVWPPLWDPGVTTFLLVPAWVVPAFIGLALLYFGLRRRRTSEAFGKQR